MSTFISAMPQPSSSPSSSTSRAPPSSGSHTASPGPAASSNTEDDISRTLGETMDRLSQNAQDLQVGEIRGSIKIQKTRVSFHPWTCNMLQKWGWKEHFRGEIFIYLMLQSSITSTAKTQISGVIVHPKLVKISISGVKIRWNFILGVFHPTFGGNATLGWDGNHGIRQAAVLAVFGMVSFEITLPV